MVKSMLNQEAVDRVFHALGDPTRRAIVEQLGRGPCSVSELARPLEISLAAVVQHLSVLEDSGLVQSEKQGRVRSCRLDRQGLQVAERWLHARRAAWEERFDRLGEVLGEQRRSASKRRRRKKT